MYVHIYTYIYYIRIHAMYIYMCVFTYILIYGLSIIHSIASFAKVLFCNYNCYIYFLLIG